MQTHRKDRIARVAFIAVALFFFFIPAAMGQDFNLKDRWGVGLRVGPSILTQDVNQGIKGDVGPVISANVMYALEEMLLLGINVEWETHKTNAGGSDLGDSTTISIIPTVEFRATEMKPFSPYLSLGMGVNLNSINLSGAAAGVFSKFEPQTTVALKAGVGTDYFFTPNLAFNTEVGYKYNSGTFDVCSQFPPFNGGCGIGNWNLSSVSILLGMRYFF